MIKDTILLGDSFKAMEKLGCFNFNTPLPIIETLASGLKLSKNNKLHSNNHNQENFQFYSSSLAVLLVMQNMSDRFNISKRMHNNPISVLNSLKVMPRIDEVISHLKNPLLTFK